MTSFEGFPSLNNVERCPDCQAAVCIRPQDVTKHLLDRKVVADKIEQLCQRIAAEIGTDGTFGIGCLQTLKKELKL